MQENMQLFKKSAIYQCADIKLKRWFSSASASLLVHGKRTSVPAKLAHGIIVDTQVIRTAPEKFIYSGIGIWCQRLQRSMTGF